MDEKQPLSGQAEAPGQYQPGATITPGQAVPAVSVADQATPAPVAAEPGLAPVSPSPAPELPADEAQAMTPVIDQLPDSTPDSAIQSEEVPPVQDAPLPDKAPVVIGSSMSVQPDPARSVTWTASEFIAHHKSAGWYIALAGVALVIAALVWLLTKDKLSSVVVVVGAVLLGTYAARKPRELEYALNDQGLTIGNRHHAFGEFRSFSIVPDGAFSSIVLMPLKRFAMFTTIYYDPADEARIMEVLARQLPHEERRNDPIEALMRRIRF